MSDLVLFSESAYRLIQRSITMGVAPVRDRVFRQQNGARVTDYPETGPVLVHHNGCAAARLFIAQALYRIELRSARGRHGSEDHSDQRRYQHCDDHRQA